jgi:cell division protein FtsB
MKNSNRLRTPPSSKPSNRLTEINEGSFRLNTNSAEKYSSNNTMGYLSTDDKCKIHLAECYTANKKIDKLTEELEEKQQAESDLKSKLGELETELKQKLTGAISEGADMKNYIEDLKEQISVLRNSHDEKDLVEYYEKKLEEEFRSKINLIKSFTQSIEKVLPDGTYATKDEIWRNLLKRYEQEILFHENNIAEFKKKERKIFLRQKFFDKYCGQTEERFEKFSKITKQFYNQEKKIDDYKQEIQRLLSENNQLKEDIDNLQNQTQKIKDDYCKTKSFVNQVKPLLKLDWEDIKRTNEENYEKIIKLHKSDDAFNSKNIIKLIENLHKFFDELENNLGVDLGSVRAVIDDVREYIIMLLKKNDYLYINQYNIINLSFELNEKVLNYTKRTKLKIDNEYQSLLNEIKKFCTALLIEYNPK